MASMPRQEHASTRWGIRFLGDTTINLLPPELQKALKQVMPTSPTAKLVRFEIQDCTLGKDHPNKSREFLLSAGGIDIGKCFSVPKIGNTPGLWEWFETDKPFTLSDFQGTTHFHNHTLLFFSLNTLEFHAGISKAVDLSALSSCLGLQASSVIGHMRMKKPLIEDVNPPDGTKESGTSPLRDILSLPSRDPETCDPYEAIFGQGTTRAAETNSPMPVLDEYGSPVDNERTHICDILFGQGETSSTAPSSDSTSPLGHILSPPSSDAQTCNVYEAIFGQGTTSTASKSTMYDEVFGKSSTQVGGSSSNEEHGQVCDTLFHQNDTAYDEGMGQSLDPAVAPADQSQMMDNACDGAAGGAVMPAPWVNK